MGVETKMAPRKAAGAPLLIGGSGFSRSLEKLGTDKTSYNEDWLQQLAFDHPEVLPVTDIEPGFGRVYAAAREVPCGHGYIDNLYITAAGDIVLVEAKLWRNHQARREVVAQALDYVSALTGMSFEGLEAACRKGQGMSAPSLYELVAAQADALPEQDFIDAVSRNLARGRMLVIALGDGIRAEAEALAGLLQSHAGAHFTFALVELAIWRNTQTGDLIALPSTLAQTVMITRGVVTIEDGKAVVRAAPADTPTRPGSISEELYYEALARTAPNLPPHLRELLAQLEPLGVYPDLKASLNLKLDLPGADKPINFGYITKTGKVWTDALALSVPREVALRYNQTLASLIGGAIAWLPSGSSYLTTNGKSAPLLAALLPEHSSAWVQAIGEVIATFRELPHRSHELSDALLKQMVDDKDAEAIIAPARTARL